MAEKARAIGLSVGLSPKPTAAAPGESPNKPKTEEEEKKKSPFKRRWRGGGDPKRQTIPRERSLSKRELASRSLRSRPDVKESDHSKPWIKTPNGEARCALKKRVVLSKKLNGDKKDLVDEPFYGVCCQPNPFCRH